MNPEPDYPANAAPRHKARPQQHDLRLGLDASSAQVAALALYSSMELA